MVVSTLTVRMAPDCGHADCAAVEFAVRASGADIVWVPRSRTGRRYGSVARATQELRGALNAIDGVNVRDEIIAIAVYPSMPEALPAIAEALGGPGAPDGVLSCDTTDDAVVVEWDPSRTPASTIYGLIDVELGRFRASRIVELLVPLSDELLARIAAEGLHAPDLRADRLLEFQLERSGVLD